LKFNLQSLLKRLPLGKSGDVVSDFTSSEYRYNLVMAVIIGVIGGYGAVGFRYAIMGVQQLGFGHIEPTLGYLLSLPWYWRLGLPVLGGLIVGPLIVKFAPEAKGHGVPEVMAAVGTRGGVIRPRVAAVKVMASAICIGTGGSAGREGPIVQIGSAVASALGQALKMSPRRLKTFVGCGAAAGIAATFNAPVAGMLFSMEIILGDFGVAALSPIIIASVIATAVSRMHLGNEPAFAVPEYVMQSPVELIHYAILGVGAAFVAVAFTRSLHSTEMLFDKIKIPDIIKPAIGGLIIGTMGAVGLPHIYGVGYELIEEALLGNLPLILLVVILVAKIIATSATLGSGGSGGIFAPSLFMGAMLGGVVWNGAHWITPDLVSPNYGPYALVGMAAVVAGTTRAPLQAILILFELTGGYEIILPLMLSAIIAFVISNWLMEDSIYTIKLRSKGIFLKRGKELNVLKDLKVAGIMRDDAQTVPHNMRLRPLLDTISETTLHSTLFVIDRNEKLKGYISFHEIRAVLFDVEALEPILTVNDIANFELASVTPDDTLDLVIRLFARKNLDELPVVDIEDHTKIIGTIHRADVVDSYNTEIMKRDLLGSMTSLLNVTSKISSGSLAPGYSMAEMEVPAHYVGKTLRDLDLRNKKGIEVMLVRHHSHGTDHETEGVVPTPDAVLYANDVLLISGPHKIVEKMAKG